MLSNVSAGNSAPYSSSDLTFNPSTGLLSVLGAVNASSYTAYVNILSANNTGAYNYGTLNYNDTNIMSQFSNNVNTYTQMILQNTNAGSSASADFIVSSSGGNATAYYGDFGINSITFAGVGSLNLAGATYLYSTNGDLVLGTATANSMHFVVNNGATDALSISSTGSTVLSLIKTYAETKTSPAISGGVLTLDLANGTIFDVSLNATVTSVSIVNASVVGSTATSTLGFVVIFTGTGSAYTVVWPGTVRWPGGVAPVVTTTNGQRDVLTFVSSDQGTTFNAFISGQNL